MRHQCDRHVEQQVALAKVVAVGGLPVEVVVVVFGHRRVRGERTLNRCQAADLLRVDALTERLDLVLVDDDEIHDMFLQVLFES